MLKASELVKLLNDAIEKHGDLPIGLTDIIEGNSYFAKNVSFFKSMGENVAHGRDCIVVE
jgi:hypothetical protein